MMFTDVETFMLDEGFDRIFRLFEYKKVYTPYEQQQAFTDESMYVSNHAQFIKIREVIDLGYDHLIGYQVLLSSEDLDIIDPRLEYRKLSDIILEYDPDDAKCEEFY